MSLLIRFTRAIESLNKLVGLCLCWSAGVMAVLVLVIVVARSFFNYGSMAMQESVTYLHAALFMLCLAWAAGSDSHVRVDIFYHRFSPLTQRWVNLFGAIVFLLPFALFMLAISWKFACDSWAIREGSINPGGIHAVYWLKSLIPVTGALLSLRALSEILDCLLAITYSDRDTTPASHSAPQPQSD